MKKEARIAGLWYLLMGVAGAFGIMYASAAIIVHGDATTTANNLMKNMSTFRWSILSGLVGQTAFIFLALSLNRLFKEVDENLNKLLKAFVLVAVPIAFLVNLCLLAAMLTVDGSAYLNAFNQTQLNALSLLFLNIYEYEIIIVQVFWGLWLLPLGLLIIKSGFMQKWIGYLLVTGCFS